MKRKGSRTIHNEAIAIFKKTIDDINKIQKERQKYGMVIATVPGLDWMNEKDNRIANGALAHIINDIKEYQRTKVKLPIGTKIEIIKVVD